MSSPLHFTVELGISSKLSAHVLLQSVKVLVTGTRNKKLFIVKALNLMMYKDTHLLPEIIMQQVNKLTLYDQHIPNIFKH